MLWRLQGRSMSEDLMELITNDSEMINKLSQCKKMGRIGSISPPFDWRTI